MLVSSLEMRDKEMFRPPTESMSPEEIDAGEAAIAASPRRASRSWQRALSRASAIVPDTAKKAIWLALRIVISIALVALLVSKANINTLIHGLLTINPILALIGLGVGFLTIILSSWQWQIVLKHEQIAIGLPTLTGLYFVGQMFGQLLPSSVGGDVAKAAYVARFSQRGVGAASATLMARVIGLAALFLTALPVAIVASLVASQLGWSLTLILAASALGYAVLLMLLLFSPALLMRLAGQRLGKSRVGRKILELAATVAIYRQRPDVFIRATLASIVFYACSNLNFYAYGLALHLHTPFWFYWIAIPITSLATLLPISLNGYGIRGASFVAVFAVMGEAAAKPLALAVAMEVQMLVFALAGGIVLLVINRQLAQRVASRRAEGGGVKLMTEDEVAVDTWAANDETIDPVTLPGDSTAPTLREEDVPPFAITPWISQHRAQIAAGLAALLFLAIVIPLAAQHLFKGTPRVTLTTVSTQSLTSYIGGGGLTYPQNELDVAYPVGAQVTAVNVQVGQAVQAGQPLITLDAAGLTAQLSQAYNQYQIAQSYVNTLLAQGATATQLAAAQQQLAVAKSRYDTINQQINSPTFNNGNINATAAGVVTEIDVTPGTLFSAGETLLKVQSVDRVIVRAQFPLEQANAIKLGESAQVDPDVQAGQPLTGTVTAIVPALTQSGSSTFEVWITVANPGHQLFTGESVYARVSGQQTLPTVPQLAVVNPDADSIVFVYSNGQAHARHVVVGVRSGDRFGIVSGLNAGDQIILVGQYQLTDGEQVSVSK